MSDLFADISGMFATDEFPLDESGCLAVVLQRIGRWGGNATFLMDKFGRVLGTCYSPQYEDRRHLGQAVELLLPLLEQNESAQVTLPDDSQGEIAAIGLNISTDQDSELFLGILMYLQQSEANPDALDRSELKTLGRVAWLAIQSAEQLRHEMARNRHLLAEQDILKQAHSETVAKVLQEREDRLQEKRHHIVQLESEVHRRSADLKAAMERANLANRTKSEFLANMSHEIRTPMTAILGYSENLLDQQLSEEERQTAIQTIRRNGQHLLELINDILDFSKIEAKRIKPELLKFSPLQVVADVYTLMRVRTEAKQLHFVVETRGRIPAMVESDPTRLRQILINLIGNAIKFTHAGEIRLVISPTFKALAPRKAAEVPLLRFDVIDTGIGMTVEQVGSLFQPFTQADASTTRQYGGTGLGLTISKRLGQALGGDLVAQSQYGSGSMFSLTIGVGELEGVEYLEDVNIEDFTKNQSTTVRGSEVALQEKCLLDETILLAEDGPDNQRLIAFVLRKAGAKVTVAENGQIAVEQAMRAKSLGKPYGLILMDMQMPVLDGYGATARLREQGYTGPIVALTAHAMVGDREKCIRAGCDDFATKPINRAVLIATIKEYLEQNSEQSGDKARAGERKPPEVE